MFENNFTHWSHDANYAWEGKPKYPQKEYEDWIKPPCRNPSHDPPNMMVITHPYHHVCPGCGFSVTIFPRQIWC